MGSTLIGNLLANHQESEIFQENPIRETSQPAKALLDDKTILVDLPGLGSVLADEDDKVVKSYIRRATILLIVISVDSAITKHLYEFLKSDTLKTKDAQHIIIVLNKTDIWDSLPEFHQQKELTRIKDFLMNGDSKTGFEGIKVLFDYDILIIPFSVRNIRNNSKTQPIESLKSTITNYLPSSNDVALRLNAELESYFFRYDSFSKKFNGINEKIACAKNESNWVDKKLNEFISNEIKSLFQTLQELSVACWNEMMILPTSLWKRNFTDCADLKNDLERIRYSYKLDMEIEIDNCLCRIKDSSLKIITDAFGICPSLPSSDMEDIYETSNNIVNSICTNAANVKIQNKDVSSSTAISDASYRIRKLRKPIDVWINELHLSTAIAKGVSHKYQEYINAYEQVKTFFQLMSEAKQLLKKSNQLSNTFKLSKTFIEKIKSFFLN